MNQQITSVRDEYLSHITAQKTSGLSTAAYCKLHNLNLNKLYHYKSYRPAEFKPKVKSVNNFSQVKIQSSEDNFKLPPTKTERLSAVQSDKVIDPEWLARFIFILSNCK